MEVAFNRSNNNFTGCSSCRFGKDGFEDGHSSMHGPGCDEDFRDVNLIVFEPDSHSIHSGDETLFQNGFSRLTRIQSLLGQFLHLIHLPL